MNRHWLIALLLGLGLGIAGLVNAGAPYSRSSWGMFTGPTSSPSFAGTVTSSGGFSATGNCTTNIFGDVICYDNNGAQGGYMVSDVAPQNMIILPESASPLGSSNKTGSILNLTGGWGTISSTAVVANCGAADTFTLTTLGQDNVLVTKTCTQDAALDDATHFTCGATSTIMATHVAACLATAAGVTACADDGCTAAVAGFAGAACAGATCQIYVMPATNEPAAISAELVSNGNHGVVTLGTWGRTMIGTELMFATGPQGAIGGTLPAASTAYLSQCTASTICAGTTGTNKEAGAFLAEHIYSRASSATEGDWSGPTLLLSSDNNLQWNSATTLASGSANLTLSENSAGVLQIGTTTANALGTAMAASAVLTSTVMEHTYHMVFCGNGPNSSTAVYLSPNRADLYGSANCSAEDSTTEATADEVWAPYQIKVGSMVCGLNDVATDAGGITFTLRANTADVGTNMSCTTTGLDGVGFNSCTDQTLVGGAYTIAAGATVDMKVVGTAGNETTANVWCDVQFTQ